MAEINNVIAEARVDARSLSEFVFKPAGFMVTRRLATPINTLQFYINNFEQVASDGAAQINQSIVNSGFIIVDSFELGANITQRNQALRHAADGKLYRWAGDLPKAVVASSTPANSGGFGANAWLEVSDSTLRQELTGAPSTGLGALKIGGAIASVSTYDELSTIPSPSLSDGQLIHVTDRAADYKWSSSTSSFNYHQTTTLSTGIDSLKRVADLAQSGNLRMAILGDSTAAGVGTTSASAYGEANNNYTSGYSMLLYRLLMQANPTFRAPNPLDVSYRRGYGVDVSSLATPFPHYNLVVMNSPTTSATTLVAERNEDITKITIYHDVRTSDGAASFDVVIKNGTAEVARAIVDTYVPPITYAGEVMVFPHLSKTTITVPTGNKSVTAHVENVKTIDRGAGAASNGTANVYGFCVGEGVDVRNFAVSSTTLENSSAANVIRGITTTERLNKAYAMSANVIVLNWGTNDAKAGGLSVNDFTSTLLQRVDEIKSYDKDCIVILATTASGNGVYSRNTEYFDAIRSVAIMRDLAVLDGERLLSIYPRIDVVKDEVHPNETGYSKLSEHFARVLGIKSLVDDTATLSKKIIQVNRAGTTSPTSDLTGGWVLVHDIPIGKATAAARLQVSTEVSLYHASLALNSCELTMTFNSAAGDTIKPTPGDSVLTSVAIDGNGQAWGRLNMSRVLTSTANFMGSGYYLKIWMKNYSLRPVENAVLTQYNWTDII